MVASALGDIYCIFAIFQWGGSIDSKWVVGMIEPNKCNDKSVLACGRYIFLELMLAMVVEVLLYSLWATRPNLWYGGIDKGFRILLRALTISFNKPQYAANNTQRVLQHHTHNDYYNPDNNTTTNVTTKTSRQRSISCQHEVDSWSFSTFFWYKSRMSWLVTGKARLLHSTNS